MKLNRHTEQEAQCIVSLLQCVSFSSSCALVACPLSLKVVAYLLNVSLLFHKSHKNGNMTYACLHAAQLPFNHLICTVSHRGQLANKLQVSLPM